MRNLKRALSLGLTAAMISGLMVMGSSAASYADVADTDNVEAIEVLEAVGIMIGDENGNFNPDQNVTRNEMAVVMSNLMEYNVASYKDTSPFTDVPSWAEPYVAACYTNGITAGTSATTYGGSDTVTTAQAALMLMKALGYFQYASDFGGDWQLATVRQGNAIDLFVGVDSGVQQAMTRNDVAQLVLNTLEAGTVKASTGGSITVGGVTINTDVKYDYVTSGETYAFAINDRDTNNDGDLVRGSIVELGEQLYMGDLRKSGGADNFDRPSSIWEYNHKEIGVYPDEANYTYTEKISQEDLYDELGSAIMGGRDPYTWEVFYNGEYLGHVIPERNESDAYSHTNTGTLTQVYLDSVERTVTVTMVDTFLAEVVSVNEKDDGTDVTVNYLGDNLANTSGRQSRITLDSTNLDEEDKVLVTLYEDGSRFSIDSIELAETVTGEVNAVKSVYDDGWTGKYAEMDGTKYNYVGNTFAKDLADTALDDPTLNSENILYLDNYGNMIAFEATERSVDYLYIQDTMDGLGGFQALATFPDGTEKTITVTELDGNKNPDENDLPAFLGQMGVYAYEQQGNDYKLTTLVKANYNDDADTDTHDKVEAGERADYVNSLNSWELAPVNGGYDNGFSVNDTKTTFFDDSLVGSDANANYQGKHASYSIRNGLNSIQVEYYDAVDGVVDATRSVVSLNNSTIFVDVEGGAVYTGYDAVPTMTDISFYVVYNRQLNADVVFITDGADNSTSDNFFFVLDENPISTKDASDGTVYREYAAMVNGEETTVVLKGINKDNAVIGADYIRENTLYRIVTITPNDEVTEVERVTDFTLVYSDTQNVPVDRTSGTLRIDGDVNISDSDNNIADNYTGERMYAYNSNDTIFVEVTLDEHGDVVDVDRSSAGAINTTNDDRAGHSNVFVLAVDDTDSRMPTATLVYIVNQDDDRFVEYTVTASKDANITSYDLEDANGNTITSGDDVLVGTVLTLDNIVVAPGYTPVVTVNDVVNNGDGAGTYTIRVTGNTDIEITSVVNTNVAATLVTNQPARVTINDGAGLAAGPITLQTGENVINVEWYANAEANAKIVMFDDQEIYATSSGNYYINVTAADAGKTLTVGAVTKALTLDTGVNASWTYESLSGNITGDGTPEAIPEGAQVTITTGLATTSYLKAGDNYLLDGGTESFTLDADTTVEDTKYHKVSLADPAITNGSIASLNGNVLSASIQGADEDGYVYVAEGDTVTVVFAIDTTAATGDATAAVNAALTQHDGTTVTSGSFSSATAIVADATSDLAIDSDTVTINAYASADLALSYALT